MMQQEYKLSPPCSIVHILSYYSYTATLPLSLHLQYLSKKKKKTFFEVILK